MPRTTLDIDATVLKRLRRRSKEQSKSMGQVASEVLAVGLNDAPIQGAPPLELVRRPMGSFKIDLEDKGAIAKLLDAEELERGSA
jgi:hypothetical protein